jgi:hypothetical protein
MFEHMPFYFENNGARCMLFCRADGERTFSFRKMQDKRVPWKVHFRDQGGNVKKIETGSYEGAVECAPTCFYDGSSWVVSFLCQFHSGNDDPTIVMHRVTTTDWTNFSEVETSYGVTGYGYENRNWTGNTKKNELLLSNFDGSYKILVAEGLSILSVGYVFDDDDKVIITGKKQNGDMESVMYSISSEETNRILDPEGKSVYKCSVLGYGLAHAVKVGSHLEHRVIQECAVNYGPPVDVVVRELK